MQYTIVLVEDEINLNNLIKTYLEKAGYNVVSFYNGKDAMDNIDIYAHLWILDIMLPDDINGKVMKLCQLYLHQLEIKI